MHIPLRVSAALALGSLLALPGVASAAPPVASDFQITYRFTDDDGMVLPSQRLVQNDLDYYVNRARCQCGEKVAAQVFLMPSQAGLYDQVQVRTFVGSNCAEGQVGNNLQFGPCVQTSDALPAEYLNQGKQVIFDLAWLSSSIIRGTNQFTDMPELDDPCGGSQTGSAGIFVCVENQMTTGCQSDEFVITGTQNQNGSSGSTGTTDPTQGGDGMSAGGIRFDYLPPQVDVTGFRASAGDGRVVIAWDATQATDLNGFRVLCADLDGNPVPGKGASEPTGSRRALGEIYFTAENLCPDAVVYESSDEQPVPDPGTGSDSGTGTGTDDAGSTSIGEAPWLGDGWSQATTSGGTADTGMVGTGTTADPGTTSAGDTAGTTVATESSSGSGSGSSSGSGSDTAGTTGGDASDSPLASLDWAFVCSSHVTRTGTSAAITGLENGKEYQFLVVAYDRAGNPLIVSDVLTAIPEETSDFWEQCEKQGDLCGSGGFCSCTTDPPPAGAAWLGTGLLLLGLARRRKGSSR